MSLKILLFIKLKKMGHRSLCRLSKSLGLFFGEKQGFTVDWLET